MKFKFPYKEMNPEQLVRRAGYGKIYNSRTKEYSYTRRLQHDLYPRFHVYLNEHETYFEVSLHLDQKRASYEGTTAHSGDYDSPVVENEARRITEVIAKVYGIAI